MESDSIVENQHQVEDCRAFPGFRIVLGNQRLESLGGYADVDMGRSAEVGLRDIAFESVCFRSISDDRSTVRIVILSVRPDKPELDGCLGNRGAVL